MSPTTEASSRQDGDDQRRACLLMGISSTVADQCERPRKWDEVDRHVALDLSNVFVLIGSRLLDPRISCGLFRTQRCRRTPICSLRR